MTATADDQDTVTHVYQVKYDSVPTNPYAALIAAQSAAPDPVPVRRTRYAGTSRTRIEARQFEGGAVNESRSVWNWTVTFSPPPENESQEGGGGEPRPSNPLLRPPVFNVEYQDREYVITKAKNVEALEHGDGKGGNRAANTLGPIVNAAGKRPDEPQIDVERVEVLVIRRNYPSLAAIVSRNRAFKRTTNSSGILGYGTRQLKYQLTQSLGVQYEDGIEFWPGETTISVEDTTDLVLDNVGYEYWDETETDWVRAVDANNEPMSEPINLKLDGDQGGDNTTTITFRHLTEKDYGPLFE